MQEPPHVDKPEVQGKEQPAQHQPDHDQGDFDAQQRRLVEHNARQEIRRRTDGIVYGFIDVHCGLALRGRGLSNRLFVL